jgi:hypothetical protein
VDNLRWTNPGQPQTLQISVFLSYFRGVFLLLFGNVIYRLLPFDVLGSTLSRIVPIILALAFIASGLGIASERKWGYLTGRIAAVYATAAVVYWIVRLPDFSLSPMIRLLFDGALVTTLFHHQSRDYTKVWFK